MSDKFKGIQHRKADSAESVGGRPDFMMGVAQELRNEHDELLSLVAAAVEQLEEVECCYSWGGHSKYCAYGKLVAFVEESSDG